MKDQLATLALLHADLFHRLGVAEARVMQLQQENATLKATLAEDRQGEDVKEMS